jgi:methylated-DNA-[protein]-cysteine S-methyltransferase
VKPTPVFSAHLTDPVLGTLRLWCTPAGIRRLDFEVGPDLARAGEELVGGDPPPHLSAALRELRDYLAGRIRTFVVPVDLHGVTSFQSRVYDRLLKIPFGQVVTYGRIAQDLGAPHSGAARAVGQSVGANPVPILIPCHRVVGADGRLTGFGGGLRRKAALLRLEGVEVDGILPSSRVHPEVLRLPL